MKNTHILAYTHRQLEVSQIGLLHIDPAHQTERLFEFKQKLKLDELMFISTCNRVEFIFCTQQEVDEAFIENFIHTLYPNFDEKTVKLFASSYEYYLEINAVKHLLKVASSIDSMIVGEREIITQVRQAYNTCKDAELTGDSIRLLIRYTIETAKKIYTQTNIAERPVSVVALAYHTLKEKNIPLDAKILVVGAGLTNSNMLRFLKKHGYTNFIIYNRTLAKAEKLAKLVNGKALPLSELGKQKENFDLIITCTGADEAVITPSIYKTLLGNDNGQKTIIDLAIPHDLDEEIPNKFVVDHISMITYKWFLERT